MSESGRDDDVAHDAMLRAALRHAPDRGVAPPEAVGRAILKAARDAVAPRRRERLADALAALLKTLRQPAAGAAFASLMLGTLVVLMWQDGPPPAPERHAERALPREPQQRAEQQLAKQAAAPTATATPPTTPPAMAPARRRIPVETADRAGAPQVESAAVDARAPATAAAPAPAAAPPVLADASANAGSAARPAGPPAVASQRTSDAAAQTDADPLAPVLAALSAPRPEAAALERRATAAPPRAAAAKAAAEEPRRADADPGTWLRELRIGARGRWQRVEASAPADAHPLHAADGRLLGRLAIEADAVLWLPANAPADQAWRATLPPEALANLRAALASSSRP